MGGCVQMLESLNRIGSARASAESEMGLFVYKLCYFNGGRG